MSQADHRVAALSATRRLWQTVLATATDQQRSELPNRGATAIAIGLILAAIWFLTHRYGGITNDAQLYAIQALARIHPSLADDLYLQNVSQDHYTFLTPFYAAVIRSIGLTHAALLLMILCRVWLLAAAWLLVRRFANPAAASLALALLIIVPGSYGGSGVFHTAEDFLSARSFAEALGVSALACHFGGHRRLGLAIATATLLVHPLMALPGLLLLICLGLSTRVTVILAIGAIAAIACVAAAATVLPALGSALPVLDPEWLAIVRERSQFLFLDLWTKHDWELNTRPLVCLALTAVVFQGALSQDSQLPKLCVSALLVAGAGIAVAVIASAIGPLAILIQGQAWRWIWIAEILAILLLVPTAVRMCRQHDCGATCSLLLVAAWDFSGAAALLSVCLALLTWLSRDSIGERLRLRWPWIFVAALIGVLTWLLVQQWPLVPIAKTAADAEPGTLQFVKRLMELRCVGLLVAAVAVCWVCNLRSLLGSVIAASGLLIACAAILPYSVPPSSYDGSIVESAEFTDWVQAIPPGSNVLVADARNSGSFVWFTLERPNYLTLSQSAGVVFSRATALEVRRRSEVLLPIMKPSWQVLTNNAEIRAAKDPMSVSTFRVLTSQNLVRVCADPQLGFVISREELGFDPIRHQQAGEWQGSNLYDCRKVRAAAGAS
jgi:hypothetical protein